MDLDQYQQAALKTQNKGIPARERLANGALGLCGEAGEAGDVVKKHLFQGHKLDRNRLKKEVGDVLWYLAVLANEASLTDDEDCVGPAFTLGDCAVGNIEKLSKRYAGGGFSAEKSIARADQKDG